MASSQADSNLETLAPTATGTSAGLLSPRLSTSSAVGRERRLRPAQKVALQRQASSALPQRDNIDVPTPYILTNFAPTPAKCVKSLQNRRASFNLRRDEAREVIQRLQHPSLKERLHFFYRHFVHPKVDAEPKAERKRKRKRRFRLDALEKGDGEGDGDGWEGAEAARACEFYFKPKADVPVVVCDFYEDKGVREVIRLGDLDEYINTKPAGVVVRWLHVPLGIGILQSTIEELFNYGGSQEMGKPFMHSGIPGFPYPCNVHSPSFYNLQHFEEQLEAWTILSKVPALRNGPTRDVLEGFSLDQIDDLQWRSDHLRKPIDFWDMVKADLPYLMSNCSIGDLNPRNRGSTDVQPLDAETRPALEELRYFKNSIMMISHFRPFHRSDGFLLTFQPMPGVDYLGQSFQDWIDPSNDVLGDPDASAIAHTAHTFLKGGTQHWHRKTVEWLMVYLITEIVSSPNNHRQGNSAPSLTNGYHSVAVDLKARQKLPWVRGETVRLVRKYLACLDELRVLNSVVSNKIKLLRGLAQDAAKFEEDYAAEGLDECNDPMVDSMQKRVEWALKQQEAEEKDIKVLVNHMEKALEELFHLRSIEQNELAIAADSQNKAILVFTAVTVIFLPLSFFTSYFGMNLTDLDPEHVDRNQDFFWKTCGSLGFGLVFLTVLYAFRSRVFEYSRRKGAKFFGPSGAPLPDA